MIVIILRYNIEMFNTIKLKMSQSQPKTIASSTTHAPTAHLYATASNIVALLSRKVRIFDAALHWTKRAV